MLKQRILTAIPLAAIVFGVIILLDTRFVAYMFALVLFLSILELVKLSGISNIAVRWIAAALLALMFLLVQPRLSDQLLYWHNLAGFLLWVGIAAYLFQYRFSGQWTRSRRVMIGLLGVGLLWICIHGLVFTHGHFSQQGGWVLMYLLSLVWVADVGAYFAGKKFGRHKLAPSISPGKTWEGVAGGLLLNLVWINLVYQLSQGWGMDYAWFLMIGLITAAMSIAGDLFVSVLKREAGVKDSGRLLPGHGGVLDRIDSVIAASPVFLTGLYFSGALA